MTEEIIHLLNYRIEKAFTTLEEAEIIIQRGFFNGGVNRLYYACFYAVTALLLTKNYSPKSHKGTRNLFHIHFVETKIISSELNRFYSELFNARKKSDYADFMEYSPETLNEWLENTRIFIKTLENHIRKDI